MQQHLGCYLPRGRDTMSSDSHDARTWTTETIAEKLQEIVAAKTNLPVTTDSTFDSLGLDSLATAEMVFEIESAFHIHADERLLEMSNLAEVVAYVEQELRRDQVPRGRFDRPTSTEFRAG